MKLKFKISFILCSILFIIVQGSPCSSEEDKTGFLSSLERSVVDEINLARSAPKDYASFLEQYKKYYHGKLIKLPDETSLLTKEGVSALVEAVQFLRSVKPVPLLSPSKGMSLAAKDHVKDLGSSGASQHGGSDKSQPWDRLNRYGTWQKMIGEIISFGHEGARDIAMSLIIDDGVPQRGHRKNIFNADFRFIGVACGEHPDYRTVCAITLAGGYIER
jgi:uncharacterized protein YkwD